MMPTAHGGGIFYLETPWRHFLCLQWRKQIKNVSSDSCGIINLVGSPPCGSRATAINPSWDEWNGPGITPDFAADSILKNLGPGIYYCDIFDANNCKFFSSSEIIQTKELLIDTLVDRKMNKVSLFVSGGQRNWSIWAEIRYLYLKMSELGIQIC
jgi:hypothetical protein